MTVDWLVRQIEGATDASELISASHNENARNLRCGHSPHQDLDTVRSFTQTVRAGVRINFEASGAAPTPQEPSEQHPNEHLQGTRGTAAATALLGRRPA